MPVPVVVAVHGAIAGAGLGLALSGDLCVAGTSSRFSTAYLADRVVTRRAGHC